MVTQLLAAAATKTSAADDIATGASAFWDAWGTPIAVAGVIVGAVVLRIIVHFVIRRVVDQIVTGVKKKQNVDDTQALNSPLRAVRVVQRTRTLGSVLNNVATVVIAVIAIATILATLNIATVGLVSAASVIAAGLAFGAQNIVKDILSGLFMVVEDQLGVGDIVDVQLATGVVEAVGIRVTQVRDVNGTLWFVRNGEILRVGNMSQGWARAIIDIAVPYENDIDEVESIVLTTSAAVAAQPRWKTRMLEKPEIWGLQSISESHLVIRLAVRTRSADKDAVARELRLRIVRALDAKGIHLPSLQSVVLSGFEEATNIRGARPIETQPTPVQGRNKAPRAPRRGRNAPPTGDNEA
ncbi:mechanosensitive ion channel family protein [Frondihabitans sp. VKM Ac-2883]|uniref:mechanosensitive ion channel family protein n=1 Tax=Frondihabitans sp. VKM Ac-2883 TaxID=2783823 RepID=UPI00188B10EF|nr:mechanosensitive ion channel domain-containing protein [Frondihabitans sp. VKM Ac-2883]MBF4576688.1 mechanosensitive ion channel [Frondihabitans sp. VKM Ac-2883]